MAYDVSRPEVIENLEELRGSLRKGIKVYRVLLNQKTGKIRFAKGIQSLESHIGRERAERAEDWKEVRLIFEGKKVDILDGANRPLSSQGLGSLAMRIASETLFVLNQMSEIDLSKIRVIEQHGKIEDHVGWMGVMSRVDAEKKLENRSVGTYLLREGDALALGVAFHFAEENRMYVHPYIVTVVESEEKISDMLILQTTKGWTVYRDDPNLQDDEIYTYYSSPEALIRTLLLLAVPLSRFG